MKTRRIHLQPGECAEIVNQYGTSMLKAITKFDRAQPCIVIYEQPGVIVALSEDAKEAHLINEPLSNQTPVVEQTILDL